MSQNKFSVDFLKISKSRPHIHEGLECVFVLSGGIELELDGKHYHMNSDDIVVINANQVHAVHGDSPALVMALYAEKDYLIKECPEISGCFINCNSADDSGVASQKYAELKRNLIQLKLLDAEKAYGYQLNMRILFLRIIYILIMNFRAYQSDEEFIKNLINAPELSDILQYMHQNFNKPISLKNMADLAFMSPHYFSRYFKKKTGESFSYYLQKIRMESAVKNLMYGNESILRIALDNGFANAKAFSEAFSKQYGDTPSVYRKRYRNVEVYESYNDIASNYEMVEGSVTELLRYMKKYDLTYEFAENEKEIQTIDLKGETKRFIRKQTNFLNIGNPDAALRSGFIRNIRHKFNLGMQYVYFRLWDKNAGLKINEELISSSWSYHIIQSIDIFYAVNLVPVFKISCEDMELRQEYPYIKEAALIGKLVQALSCHYPNSYSGKWMFEICLGNINAVQSACVYREIYLAIKEILPNSPIGLFSVEDCKKESIGIFSQRLSAAVSSDCKPDFVSFSVFPNSLKADYLPDTASYPVKGYYKSIAVAVKNACENALCGGIPMFMLDWNTITGSNQGEINFYFRSALILNALIELNEFIDGAGFWYDTTDSYFLSDDEFAVALALYMYNGIKRPVHFALEVYMRLGSEVLWESDNSVVTYDKEENEWVILIWNPNYMNPFYCTGSRFVDSEAITVNLEIKGFDKGRYLFKKFEANRDISCGISQYILSGLPNFNDKDVHNYLQSSTDGQMTLFEEDISGGSYIISSDIDMNGIVMFIVQQVG